MSSVLDRAKLHFQPKLDEPKTILIPEWAGEGDPEGKFNASAVTLHDRQKLQRLTKDDIELGVEVIILKLKDKNGEPAFTKADKPDMMRKIDPEVVARVAKEILYEADAEEAEKN